MERRTIADLLGDWEFEPEGLCLRLIEGDDGRPKLQVRLDLGMLQLELEGRPDGQRPHGFDSLLDYHLDRAAQWRKRYGTPAQLFLTPDECEALRAEATQYYQRYFSLFHLGYYAEVIRDTSRNLRVLDLCYEHAEDDDDRWELEQYRPYITMINALSRAELLGERHEYDAAIRVLSAATALIRSFAEEHAGRFEANREVDVLTQRLKEFEQQRPSTEAELLQRRLADAIEREDYETAAELRDQLNRLDTSDLPPFWE